MFNILYNRDTVAFPLGGKTIGRPPATSLQQDGPELPVQKTVHKGARKALHSTAKKIRHVSTKIKDKALQLKKGFDIYQEF